MKTIATCKPILTIGTALSALLFAGAVHAWAAVTADPAVAPPTGQVTVSGAHFSANSLVEVFLKWKRCSVTTDAQGQFACTFKVPKALEPGPKKIWTVNRANGRWVSTPFTVRTDWGNEAFDAGRTRYNPYENVLNRTNVGKLKHLWNRPGSLQLVSGGRVFVKPTDFTGVQALNEADGKEVWRFEAGYVPSLASSNGYLYTTHKSADHDVSDELSALRVTDGSARWTISRLREEMHSWHPVLALWSGRPHKVYLSEGLWYGYEYSSAFSVEALSTRNGHPFWAQGLFGDEFSSNLGSFLVADGFAHVRVHVSSTADGEGEENAVLNADDGAVLRATYWFCYEGQEDCSSAPSVVSAGGGLVIERNGNRIFDGSGPPNPSLIVSKAGEPTQLWSWSAGPEAQLGYPALTPAVIYVGVIAPTESRLYALKTRTGEMLWNRVISGNITIQPTVANGVIYLGNKAYDARNGDLLGTNPALVDTLSPIVVNGRLYANQTDGNVSAWGIK